MRTIYKYPLEIKDEQTITMPSLLVDEESGKLCLKHQCLFVGVQNNVPCIWAMVNDNIKGERLVHVHLRGTGHDCSGLDTNRYLGTIMLYDTLVFHVFVDE